MILDLGQPSWSFDTETRLALLTFTQPCPRDEPDPAAWRPSFDFRLSIPLQGVVEKLSHQDPDEPAEVVVEVVPEGEPALGTPVDPGPVVIPDQPVLEEI